MNDQSKCLSLGAGVIRTLLSEEWFDRHIMPEGRKGIFTVDEATLQSIEHSFGRVIDFAEVLYNLQDAPGFDECIKRLYEGNVEGCLAELDFARMLYINRVLFRFVVPVGIKKSDYDFQIIYPNGVLACADTKCKIETTDFTENGIRNVLNEARKQLPNELPGVVFVKVPSRWLYNPLFAPLSVQCAKRFLGGVSRIVSVKYYSSLILWQDNTLMIRHAHKEVSNPNTDFGNNINWDIFQKGEFPPEWNGAPPHWQRVFYFPDGKPR
jgi:hypothetical protein